MDGPRTPEEEHRTNRSGAMTITTIGLDTSKSWFQVHCVDADGRTVLRRKLARSKVLSFFANIPSCLVGLEACGGSHFWARELAKLGHDVRLMPARYVRAYVKTNKHDAADDPVRAGGNDVRLRGRATAARRYSGMGGAKRAHPSGRAQTRRHSCSRRRWLFTA